MNLKVKLLRGVTPPPESDTSSSVGSAACTTDIVHMKTSVYSLRKVLWAIYTYFTSLQGKPDLAMVMQGEAAGGAGLGIVLLYSFGS